MRLVLIASVLMVGCYTPKRIVIAPTELGVMCSADCSLARRMCEESADYRRHIACAERHDACLMGCDGARIDDSPEAESAPILLPPQ